MSMKNCDKSIISIYAASMIVGSGVSGVNAILQKLIEEYPEVGSSTVYLVSTIPSLLATLVTLLFGFMVGRKFTFRASQILGMALCLVGGVLPAWLNDPFALIIIARILFGIGIGLMSFRITIIMNSYEDVERAKILGMNIVWQNLGGAAIQYIVGFLGDIKYNYAFLTYFLCTVPLALLILFLREPAAVSETSDTRGDKPKVYPVIILIAFLYAFVTGGYNMMLLNTSTLVSMKNFGSAEASGLVQACFTIGAAIGGLVFDKFYAAVKRYIVGISAAVFISGIICIMFSKSLLVYALGMALCGFVGITAYPLVCLFAGLVSDKKSMAVSMAIISTFAYSGIFLANYGIRFVGNICGDYIIGPLWAVIVIYLLLGVVFTIKDPHPKSIQ